MAAAGRRRSQSLHTVRCALKPGAVTLDCSCVGAGSCAETRRNAEIAPRPHTSQTL